MTGTAWTNSWDESSFIAGLSWLSRGKVRQFWPLLKETCYKKTGYSAAKVQSGWLRDCYSQGVVLDCRACSMVQRNLSHILCWDKYCWFFCVIRNTQAQKTHTNTQTADSARMVMWRSVPPCRPSLISRRTVDRPSHLLRPRKSRITRGAKVGKCGDPVRSDLLREPSRAICMVLRCVRSWGSPNWLWLDSGDAFSADWSLPPHRHVCIAWRPSFAPTTLLQDIYHEAHIISYHSDDMENSARLSVVKSGPIQVTRSASEDRSASRWSLAWR